jgi:hypothetical protein
MMSTSSLPKAGTTPHPSLEIFRGRPSQDDLFEKPTLIGSGASYVETLIWARHFPRTGIFVRARMAFVFVILMKGRSSSFSSMGLSNSASAKTRAASLTLAYDPNSLPHPLQQMISSSLGGLSVSMTRGCSQLLHLNVTLLAESFTMRSLVTNQAIQPPSPSQYLNRV